MYHHTALSGQPGEDVAKILVVDDEPCAPLVMQQRPLAESPVVRIFGDEALALVVDDDAAGHGGRWVEGEADETLVHVDGGAAHEHREVQPALVELLDDVAEGKSDWRDLLRPALAELAPAAFSGAAHGLIRVGHAVRALERRAPGSPRHGDRS